MRIILIILITISGLNVAMLAQERRSFDEYFRQSVSNVGLDDTIQLTNVKPTWINEIDFRTETDDFEFDRQQYQIRIKPSTKSINSAMKDLMQSYQNKQSLTSSIALRKTVDETYDTLLDWHKLSTELSTKRELLINLQDQEKVYQKLLADKSSAAINWLNVQNDITELENEILEIVLRLEALKTDARDMDWSGMISIDDIGERIAQNVDVYDERLDALKSNLSQDIIDKEMQLEKAQKNKYFDFLQLAYRGPTANPFRESVSVTAAFNLPFSNKSKLKLAELMNERLEIDLKKASNTKAAAMSQDALRSELNILLSIHNELSSAQKADNVTAEQLIARINDYDISDPMILLKTKELSLKKGLSALKHKSKIYKTYIEYLQSTEVIYQLPLNNYLKAK